MKTSTISHPQTKCLSGTIISLDNPTRFGDLFETIVFGCEEWHKSFKEAKAYVHAELQYEYSGQRAIDIAAGKAYSRSEQIACGNY